MVHNTAAERPIKTFEELYSPELFPLFEVPCLMETREFLKQFHQVHKQRVSRRTLQLYSSPQLKLLPLPIHRGGHKSYYLNPEHTNRLAVILYLQTKLYFPLKAIQKVVRNFPEEHYRLILNGTLSGEEILDFALLISKGYDLRDIIYRKVCHTLEAIDDPYWKAVEKHGKHDDEAHYRFIARALMKELDQMKSWLRGGRYRKIELEQVGRTKEEWQLIQALADINRKKKGSAGG
ncbi:MAG: MerR family transcriptional regulator [Elusimicrobiota bacterium]